MLTTAEVAKMLGVAESTLRYWRLMRRGPPYVKAEGKVGMVRYRLEDVERWVEERKVGDG